MSDFFLRQEQAKSYANAISDDSERVFTQAALCRAIGFLVQDLESSSHFPECPFDLLKFVHSVHALVKDKKLVNDALSGKYKNFEDIPDIFLTRFANEAPATSGRAFAFCGADSARVFERDCRVKPAAARR